MWGTLADWMDTFDLSAAVNSALNKLGNSVLYHKVSLVGEFSCKSFIRFAYRYVYVYIYIYVYCMYMRRNLYIYIYVYLFGYKSYIHIHPLRCSSIPSVLTFSVPETSGSKGSLQALHERLSWQMTAVICGHRKGIGRSKIVGPCHGFPQKIIGFKRQGPLRQKGFIICENPPSSQAHYICM